ncbi:ESPR-type extended signal peptide-containing protein, partial [Burkholderia metallica]|uniref:ESPR-type extended signal peptide-containing protein n=1 Tax=Burkholderia metallica TaxID=488729 RepID=UPI0023AAF9C5
MNKSYKVVWNASSGTWAAASEIAKSRSGGKSSKKSLMKLKRIHGVSAGEMIYRPILNAAESMRVTARENTIGLRKAPVVLALSIGAGMVGSATAETHVGLADGGSAHCVTGENAALEKCSAISGEMAHSEDVVRKPSVYVSGANVGDHADADVIKKVALSSDSGIEASTPKITSHAAGASDIDAVNAQRLSLLAAAGDSGQAKLKTEGGTTVAIISGDRSANSEAAHGIAIGSNAQVTRYLGIQDSNSIAIGANSLAQGYSGLVALGPDSMISGIDSTGAIAIGSGAQVHSAKTVTGSIAIGAHAKTDTVSSVALGEGSEADRANTVSVGRAGHERQIASVAGGSQGTDAVNVTQLSGVATALGGGAGIGADGTVTAPTYTLDGGKTTVQNVGAALSNLDGRVTTNATNVEKLQGNFADTGLLDAKTGKVTAAVTSDQMNAAVAKASSDRLDAGWVTIGKDAYATSKNVAIGTGAKADTEGAGTGVIAIGDGAAAGRPGYSGAIAIGQGARAVDGLQGGYLRPVAIGAGAQAQGVSVAIGPDAQSSPGNGVALGHQASVGADATWAVALGTGSSADRANTVSVGNAASQRQIVNVAAGTLDTDVVNVTQLKGVTTALGGGAGIGADGSVTAPKYQVGDKTYGNVGDAITAAAETGGGTDPNAVAYDDATKSTITLSGEQGTTLKNVAAGAVSADSTDAVNGSQLYGASQSVASALGGGSAVDAAGKLTAPTYTLDGGKTAAHNVGEAVSNLDGRVTTNATNVEKLQDNLA